MIPVQNLSPRLGCTPMLVILILVVVLFCVGLLVLAPGATGSLPASVVRWGHEISLRHAVDLRHLGHQNVSPHAISRRS